MDLQKCWGCCKVFQKLIWFDKLTTNGNRSIISGRPLHSDVLLKEHTLPVPTEYSRAADHFYEFLLDVRDSSGLGSTHQAYTMVQGVLQAFRRRLDIKDAILFAGVLPVGLRALFVVDWDTDEDRRPFEDRVIMTKEVQALRADHNFALETAIRDVARALWRHVDQDALNRILARLPEDAAEFWKP